MVCDACCSSSRQAGCARCTAPFTAAELAELRAALAEPDGLARYQYRTGQRDPVLVGRLLATVEHAEAIAAAERVYRVALVNDLNAQIDRWEHDLDYDEEAHEKACSSAYDTLVALGVQP